ncbi:MAG: bifunctional phosphoribosylaminoimidazolecarboxamide formyltransferase/IMP cyclohydrolase, partial [Pyrinomonadaceae bacterium]
MTEESTLKLKTIRRALISVSDKNGLIEFARTLLAFEIELISTGGTAKILREGGLAVREVSELTGFPEMLDGRVKTLHPKIHGGILAIRDNLRHCAELTAHSIEAIDLVVINLYPFEETVMQDGVTIEEAVEQIDIGGPAMIRSAAKNWRDVAVVVSPNQYAEIVEELKIHSGAMTASLRGRLARQAFSRTARYDGAISSYLEKELRAEQDHPISRTLDLSLQNISDLRYGENPHQFARLFSIGEQSGIAHAVQISGKEMSYNNYLDADAVWNLVNDFTDSPQTACAIIKHMNPAGVALANNAVEAYTKALTTDPVSAFGGVVAFNCIVDEEAARAVSEIFTEVIIASGFEDTALEILLAKKNLRILQCEAAVNRHGLEYRSITGGLLV